MCFFVTGADREDGKNITVSTHRNIMEVWRLFGSPATSLWFQIYVKFPERRDYLNAGLSCSACLWQSHNIILSKMWDPDPAVHDEETNEWDRVHLITFRNGRNG